MEALFPVSISDAMLVTSSVAEPDTGEQVWNPATAYAADERVIRLQTHRVYRCLVPGTNSTPPEDAPDRWNDERPTNRWAWADTVSDTQTTAPGSFSVTVDAGAVTEVGLMKLSNVDEIRLEVWDSPTGSLIDDRLVSTEEYTGSDPEWDFWFGTPRQGDRVVLFDIEPSLTARVRVTFSSYDGATLGVGLIGFGQAQKMGVSTMDVSTKHRNFSKIREDDFGNTTIRRGKTAKDISGETEIDINDANAVEAFIADHIDQPGIYIPSRAVEHRFLTTYGLGEGELSPIANAPRKVRLRHSVRGLI